MMFLSFILAVVSLAHVSSASGDQKDNFDTALILKQYNSSNNEFDHVLLLKKGTGVDSFSLPGTGGDNHYQTGESDYASALVHRFLEDTGLEKFPALTKVKCFKYARNNRHPVRIYEAETSDPCLTGLNKIKTDNPTGRYGFTSHVTNAPRSDLHHNFPVGTGNTDRLIATHQQWIVNLLANTDLDKNAPTDELTAFAGATLRNNKVVKAQSEEPVEEPPIQEPTEEPQLTPAQLAQQQQAAQLQQQQTAANANNATTGNAATTTEGEDKKKDEKKKSLAWLWITLAVVGVLAIAVTAYCCMSGDSTPEQEELV